jgi:hypothetical protein
MDDDDYYQTLSRKEFAEHLINAVSIDDMETVDAMLEQRQYFDHMTLLETAAWSGSERMVRKFLAQHIDPGLEFHYLPLNAVFAAAVHGNHVHIVRILREFMTEHTDITIELNLNVALNYAWLSGYHACSQDSLRQHMRWTPLRAIWVAACVSK